MEVAKMSDKNSSQNDSGKGSGKADIGSPVDDSKYEANFGDGLLKFVKDDTLLRPIYDRFILECYNITEVIDGKKVNSVNIFALERKFEELSNGIQEFDNDLRKVNDELKKASEEKSKNPDEKKYDNIIKKLDKAKRELYDEKSKDLALADMVFHEKLFEIGGNLDRLKKITTQMDKVLQKEIWRSIVCNTNHYMELKNSHCEILDSIKKVVNLEENNKEEVKELAITAMQKHFAVILVHFYSANQQLNQNS